MSTLELAISIATKAHANQKDLAGEEYINHPLRVMEAGKTPEEKIVGVLHDVFEDSDMSFTELERLGFSADIISALKCLTKRSGKETYDEYLERIGTNRIAIAVKINDLTDNMNIRRLKEITDTDVARLRKYHRAYKKMTTHLQQLSNNLDLNKNDGQTSAKFNDLKKIQLEDLVCVCKRGEQLFFVRKEDSENPECIAIIINAYKYNINCIQRYLKFCGGYIDEVDISDSVIQQELRDKLSKMCGRVLERTLTDFTNSIELWQGLNNKFSFKSVDVDFSEIV
jgi:hypothetical protein